MVRDAEIAPAMLHMERSRAVALEHSRHQRQVILGYTIQPVIPTSIIVRNVSC